MIDVKELRIGNCFCPGSSGEINIPQTSIMFKVGAINKFGEVEVIDPERTHNLKFRHNEVHPIPLTPSILEKSGFVKQNNAWNLPGESEDSDSPFSLFDHNYCKGELDLKLNVAYLPILSVKYLHQLQNLYFALTGQELNTNSLTTPTVEGAK